MAVKNEAGLSEKFLQQQKKKLLNLKTEIINSLSEAKSEFHVSNQTSGEDVEVAQLMRSQDLQLAMHHRKLQKLRDIDDALYRIEDGSYGLCEDTGDPIEQKRLEKYPYVRLCLQAAEDLEREQGLYRHG